VSIVAFADNGSFQGIQNARAFAASALIEIAWILFQERGENGASDQGAANVVSVRSAIALCIALRALSVSAKIVVGLLQAGSGGSQPEGDGVYDGLPCKLELLLGCERSGIGDVADIEIRNENRARAASLAP
jgi:hypothetical protein